MMSEDLTTSEALSVGRDATMNNEGENEGSASSALAGAQTTLLGAMSEAERKTDAVSDHSSGKIETNRESAGSGEDNPDDLVSEDGKYDLVMQEGVELDEGLLEVLSPHFKEIGLTRSQAQALADRFMEHHQKQAEAQNQAWGETVEGWLTQARADREIGGSKWHGSIAAASSVVERFATPELLDYLNITGAGNHPELIRLMARIGDAIGEDKPEQGKSGAALALDPAYQFFPNDRPQR